MTLGFGALTVFSVFLEVRQRNRAAGSRLAGAMALFLFAISFVHFGSAHPRQMWEGEIALHHAGLPLALLVILQDYRFLLLDTFLRFILNASLGAGALLLCIRVLQSQDLRRHLAHPFEAGLLFVVACLALTTFVYLRNRMQRLLTRALFLRANIEEPLRELRESRTRGRKRRGISQQSVRDHCRILQHRTTRVGPRTSRGNGESRGSYRGARPLQLEASLMGSGNCSTPPSPG